MKRWDLMHSINARGTFLVSKTCIPHLKNAENPHVLMLSPPLDMRPRWFAPHVASHHGEIRRVALRARHVGRIPQ
ncbi:MAG: hypothetical protein R3C55_08135 [Parvularculaceae bacterium]